jgi:cell division protein ZapE
LSPLSPLKQYGNLARQDGIVPDRHQESVVKALDSLWLTLQKQRQPSVLDRIRRNKRDAIQGLYIWGSVGRGKTWLMDLFYENLPVQRKQRVHFHRFMQRVHRSLREQGQVSDPLNQITAEWAENCSVLCLDEFFVSDIADAMLLDGLLKGLFLNGVTLVTTTNIPPDNLYEGGLQRVQFLPAIELIKQHTQVIELSGSTDFRLRILEQSATFHHPLSETADHLMTESYNRMSADLELNHELEINGRDFQARRRSAGIIWFDFEELCGKPRGNIDFIEIARAFKTVLLSNVPVLDESHPDAARRFVNMIDEFYDRNVKLLISADAPVKELYRGRKLDFEFQRTVSRLVEMQSREYLARPHLC